MKPWVKVSTCPVGKYRDTSRYSSKGWNAFFTVYQDPQGWLGEGIRGPDLPDDVFPGQRFLSVCPRLAGNKATDATSSPDSVSTSSTPDEGNWTTEEVERQMHFIRSNRLAGEAHYRVKYLMDNTQGVYDLPAGSFLSISGTTTADAVD